MGVVAALKVSTTNINIESLINPSPLAENKQPTSVIKSIEIPIEIMVEVFKRLSYSQLTIACKVSSTWRTIINEHFPLVRLFRNAVQIFVLDLQRFSHYDFVSVDPLTNQPVTLFGYGCKFDEFLNEKMLKYGFIDRIPVDFKIYKKMNYKQPWSFNFIVEKTLAWLVQYYLAKTPELDKEFKTTTMKAFQEYKNVMEIQLVITNPNLNVNYKDLIEQAVAQTNFLLKKNRIPIGKMPLS